MSEQNSTAVPWWQRAVIYQVYPRSFWDHDGDGVGDLRGVLQRLPYLQWLGVDALWISPFYKSPMHDFGYDVSDYCDVEPVFGSLDDFKAVVARAHELGLRVMIDWVPSHTSSEHAWFEEARRSRSSSKRDFYIFRDAAADGGPPNGWLAAFPPGASAWTLDAATGQYYLHSFLPQQPDLNWANDQLSAEMLNVLRFWLDLGVDGFRADVVHNLAKDAALAELPEAVRALPCMLFNDQPATHARLRQVRQLLDGYPGDRAMVGEVFLLDSEKVASYYGRGDELHMCFDFVPLYSAWQADAWRKLLGDNAALMAKVGGWPTWVLNNHDQKRVRTRLGGSEAKARAACVLLLTLRGTPFVYMGEELGLEDAVIDEAHRVDPGDRDGCRAPLPWTATERGGWTDNAWLPSPPDCAARSVQSQTTDPKSVLSLYRRVLAARKASPALQLGDFQLLDAPANVLAYRRGAGADSCEVLVNFGEAAATVPWPGDRRVLVSSDGEGEGQPFGGTLAANQAVLLGT